MLVFRVCLYIYCSQFFRVLFCNFLPGVPLIYEPTVYTDIAQYDRTRDVHFLEKMQIVIVPNLWTIATTANIMVFKYFHVQAGVQLYLIKWLEGC